jgi:alpha-L-fucosidase
MYVSRQFGNLGCCLALPQIMKFRLVFACAILSMTAIAQTYEPTWESLDKRPVPLWYKQGKFGIFIHWGVYSVPAWCTKGNYAEWYQYGLQTTDTARQRYHKRNYGNQTYYQLADRFKADLFNPTEWAELFEKSGATYIVLTSKHHDGYTLWPSAEANKTWGFPWNAKDIGPQRDLLGELFTAVKKTSVRAGMYYSLYEWFNPLWLKDKNQYVEKHMTPQMKELITKYQPDVFWTDGDWDASAETWKSKEFLTWLYNESPVKNKVVTIDRWGSGVRFNHGGVYSPEYQPNLDFENHYWEESRGLGYSYGYNRMEDAWDYSTTQALVLHLVDKVSRGGNFLLDIGPDEHGKIPPIMQERLLQMGEWLDVNGEAIYNTSRWKIPCQWSEGRRDYVSKGGDYILKLTVDPDSTYAVKEVFFTYNEQINSLYAIIPEYPDSGEVLLKNLPITNNTQLTLLATGQRLTWKVSGNNVVVNLPPFQPQKMKTPYAMVIKIKDFGDYIRKPQVNVTYAEGSVKPTISVSTPSGSAAFYMIDGNAPDDNINPALFNQTIWTSYKEPFTLEKSAKVTVKSFSSFSPHIIPSDAVTVDAVKHEWQHGKVLGAHRPGLHYWYDEPNGSINMNVAGGNSFKVAAVADHIGVDLKQRPEKFVLRFEGFIKIEKEGMYEFHLTSDDGSKMWLNNQQLINNDGEHGMEEKSGKALLRKGLHNIRILYFDSGGGNGLKLEYTPPEGKRSEIPAGSYYH